MNQARAIRRVLVVAKESRFVVEQKENMHSYHCTEAVWAMWRYRHEVHQKHVANLQAALTDNGIEHRTVSVFDYCASDAQNVDAVVSAGGDGTLLRSASRIHGPIPLVGVNTDPERSLGLLTVDHGQGSLDVKVLAKCLARGDYVVKRRQRIRTVIPNTPAAEPGLWALNEVALMERMHMRTFDCMLSCKDGPTARLKCSGVLLSTGSGSTGWMKSVLALDEDVVSRVLREANVQVSPEAVREITERYNKNLEFPVEEPQIRIVQQETIHNRVYPRVDFPKFAKEVYMETGSSDAVVLLDGMNVLAVPSNQVVKFSMEPEDVLSTIHLHT